jgi:hypothetical protein
MLGLQYQLIQQKIKNLSAATYPAFISLVLLFVSSGCVQKAQQEVQLKINSVQSTRSNGIYNVIGTTNLPDSSRITVTAIRYLYPTAQQQEEFLNSEPSTNRSILARQIVEVKQGQWQADLNLWQVAPDGSYQEVWQAHQAQMKLSPENSITFTATFDPASQVQNLKSKNWQAAQLTTPQLEGKSLRFTKEGEIYVQASQTLSIPLPVGTTKPPRPQPQDYNDGWGNRHLIPKQSLASGTTVLTPAQSRQTNAPIKPSQLLR